MIFCSLERPFVGQVRLEQVAQDVRRTVLRKVWILHTFSCRNVFRIFIALLQLAYAAGVAGETPYFGVH